MAQLDSYICTSILEAQMCMFGVIKKIENCLFVIQEDVKCNVNNVERQFTNELFFALNASILFW